MHKGNHYHKRTCTYWSSYASDSENEAEDEDVDESEDNGDAENNHVPGPRPADPAGGSTIQQWRVVFQSGVNVRAEPNSESTILSRKLYGELVVAEQQGDWLELHVERGFIRVRSPFSLFRENFTFLLPHF